MKIEKATKRKQKLRLALTGGTGSGKTYSALMLAHEMGSKICVIDTENESASLYVDDFPEYFVNNLEPPFSPERYIEAITKAENDGYDVIIIDSLTHAWSGQGGCLEMVDAVAEASRSKNTYTAWAKVTPEHNKLLDKMVRCKSHLIVTMRSKMAQELVNTGKGLSPQKIGLQPIQREGIEYEFTTVFNLDQYHRYTCSKDRTRLFDNPEIPAEFTKDIAVKLIDWLNSGEEIKETESIIEKNIETLTFDKEFAKSLYKSIKVGDLPLSYWDDYKEQAGERGVIIPDDILNAFNKLKLEEK